MWRGEGERGRRKGGDAGDERGEEGGEEQEGAGREECMADVRGERGERKEW